MFIIQNFAKLNAAVRKLLRKNAAKNNGATTTANVLISNINKAEVSRPRSQDKDQDDTA